MALYVSYAPKRAADAGVVVQREAQAADELAAHPTWAAVQASAMRLKVTVRPVFGR